MRVMQTPMAALESLRLRAAAGLAAATALSAVFVLCPPSTVASAQAGTARFPCSGANGAKLPCRFGTPSGNIRCLWTPRPNSVECVLRSSGRAYRLRPSGSARAVRLRLVHRGQTLPRSQQIVFPGSLSCRDTNTTMTCNQDFGDGEFLLAIKGSHSS